MSFPLNAFRKAQFVLSAVSLETCPTNSNPKATFFEVAFIGRSNVGKSSLLNALTQQNNLARVSHTPGRTQQLNYFTVDKHYMVDMPGYGFAKVPLPIIYQWKQFIVHYLESRESLKCLYILIDARHGLKKADLEFLEMLADLRAPIPYAFVLTKADQISKEIAEKRRHELQSYAKQHKESADVFLTSSRSVRGNARAYNEESLNQLRQHIWNKLNIS